MKELSIEQKAKAYDIALDKIKRLLGTGSNCSREDLEYVFPELAESEDEKIRNGIIQYLEQSQFGEEHYQIDDDIVRNYIVWLDKQRERKPTMLELCEIEHIEHGKFYYCIKDYYDAGNKIVSKGDVIQALKGTSIMGLGVRANEYFIPVYKIIQEPAEWSEEEEVKLQNTIDYIEELIHITKCNPDIDDDDTIKYYQDSIHWLKSLKDKVQPQPKQEWTEKDIAMSNFIALILKKYQSDEDFYTFETTFKSCIDWLKSLRLQSPWKPSDKQIMALRWVLNHIPYDSHKEEISGLLEQLKKLREE